MITDPLSQLAVAIARSPKSYAVLLGSGVSRAASIKTGWEITLDLVRRLAVAEGQSPADPEAWYVATYGSAPDYSAVLDRLSGNRHDRQAIIRPYFEPTAAEADTEAKRPTAAHRAIADLVADGLVNLVITTNFDRLMETAVRQVGIEPVIIASSWQYKTLSGIARNACTILKLHGDYLDPHILNTPDELESYQGDVSKVLAQLLEDHALIVAGWSGVYDTALRAALSTRGNSPRALYWTHREPLMGVASDLADQQGAVRVSVSDADTFFCSLRDKARAVRDFSDQAHITDAYLIAEATRILSQPNGGLRFRLLLNQALLHLHDYLTVAGRDCLEPKEPEEWQDAYSEVIRRTRSLRILAVMGITFREEETSDAIVEGFKVLLQYLTDFRHTPAASSFRIAAYAMLASVGVASVANARYRTFSRLVCLDLDPGLGKINAVSMELIPGRVFMDWKPTSAAGKGGFGSESEWLFRSITGDFRNLFADEVVLGRYFDDFQTYSLLLYSIGHPMNLAPDYDARQLLQAAGRSLAVGGDITALWASHDRLHREHKAQTGAWPPLAQGLFKDRDCVNRAFTHVRTHHHEMQVAVWGKPERKS